MNVYVPDYPERGPWMVRCPKCLQPITVVRYHDGSYNDAKEYGKHLHWRCSCGSSFVTKTAEDSGRDAMRQ